ncbi:MAG: DUF885 family protein, partial [Chloroflexi bacterium]|nr:DUF885 family protein [Chloroflexota bacterium]
MVMTAPGFASVTEDLLSDRWSFYPTEASHHGIHQYDGRLPDLSATACRHRVSQLRRALLRLKHFEGGSLSADEQFDLRLLRLSLERELADLTELAWLAFDPQQYIGHLDVIPYIQRAYAPLPERVGTLTRLLGEVPDFLEMAHARLRPDLPAPVLKMGIESFDGLLRFYRKDLPEALAALQDAPLRVAFQRAHAVALETLKVFLGRLRERQPRAVPEFALGSQRLMLMLRTGEMVDLPLERLEAVGRADLQANLERLREACARIDSRASPREIAYDRLGEDRATAESLIGDARAMLEEIRSFILEREIVSIPSEVRCAVTETPAFMRWAFAAMDMPGALETVATEAFYYVTPVEPDWTPEQATQWL